MALSIGELVGYVDLDTSAAEGAADKFGGFLEGKGGAWGKVLGGVGLAAGGLFGASLSGAMSDEVSLDKLTAKLGLTESESKRIGGVAGDLYANAYGESLDDVTTAIDGVVKNIDGMKNASSADLQNITAQVMDVAGAFEQDLGMTTAAVGQLMRTGMAKDAEQALDIITKGLQSPANKADDLLETFNEYGTQFRKLGLDGKDAVGLLSQGLQAGARDADIVADAFKEFSLRITGDLVQVDSEGNKSLTELGAAFEAAGVKVLTGKGVISDAAMDMQDKIAAGGKGAREGLGVLLDGLRETENPLQKSRSAVALFGTQAEDLGDALYALDVDTARKGLGSIGTAAEDAGKALNDNAKTNLTAFTRSVRQAFVETVGGKVLPTVTALTGSLVTGLGPALSLVGDAFSAAAGFIAEHEGIAKAVAAAIALFLIPNLILMGIEAVKSAGKSVWAWTVQQGAAVKTVAVFIASKTTMVAGWALMGAKAMLGAAKVAASWLIAMGPIGLVIAAVVGVVALIVKNWDTIKDATRRAWSWVSDKVKDTWDSVKTAVSNGIDRVVDWVRAIPGKFTNAMAGFTETVRGLFRDAMDAGKDKVTGIGGAIMDWIRDIPRKIGELGGKFGSAGRDLLQSFIDGMKNAAGIISGIAGNVWDTVKGLLNGAIDRINRALEFTINLPGPKDLVVNLPDIPRLATGGRATSSTLAVIGEGREPESVLPDSVLRGLLERAHAAGAASVAGGGRGAPLIGAVNMPAGVSADEVAERLWFKTRTRG